MGEWQYRLIRYAPDMARGERLNIGVCLFDGKRYHFRFADPWTRIRYFDPQFDASLFADVRMDLETHANNPAYIEDRIAAFDPTFAFSDARTVLGGQSPEQVLAELYGRLIHMPFPDTPLFTR